MISNIGLQPGEHGIIIGKTGCGKSVLAKHLLQISTYKNLIIIDPKREFESSGLVVTDKANIRLSSFHFRPYETDLTNLSVYDTVLKNA